MNTHPAVSVLRHTERQPLSCSRRTSSATRAMHTASAGFSNPPSATCRSCLIQKEIEHQTAQGLLNDTARNVVQALLREGQSLATISTWPDELKQATRGSGPLADDPEAQQFSRDFPDNRTWHFVNLPLGTAAYGDGGARRKPL